MKKIMNSPAHAVRELLEGIVALSPANSLLSDENIVIRSGLPEFNKRDVAVISGGGSGHEPAHAGYVGAGMLTAAVAGDVFTSPSADAVLTAIRAASGSAGALLIVKNYTGDRLNFGLAAELARAEGFPVEIVVVADDVALSDIVPADRRRGIAGTILVHRQAGAAAALGLKLDDVAAVARSASERIASMGVALGSCTLPSAGARGFSVGENEIEIGLGIHGEPGIRRMELATADTLASIVIDAIQADGKVGRGDQVVALINGLGSTPPMELAIVSRAVLKTLDSRNIQVVRAWAGTFLSALDMPGFSVSLMRIVDRDLELFDTPANAPSWPSNGLINRNPVTVGEMGLEVVTSSDSTPTMSTAGQQLRDIVNRVAGALIEAEDNLARLDAIAGDGDLGASMRRGAEGLLALDERAFTSISSGLATMSVVVRKTIAGSSGPFYATALLRASRHLEKNDQPTVIDIARAFSSAVEAITDLGGAKPGDRTMIDALRPTADVLMAQILAGASLHVAWQAAVVAAEVGMQATCKMFPKLGRASYLGERAMGSPDAGAAAVVTWLKAVERCANSSP
ncbi:dihydroxyacetone kinase [Rhizobium sp. Root73]|uniref:dihydroxyacetone kinase family protein n=1 Tax=unclassified Rhizobium TaxID=2613769 RepID=UPI00072A9338|nr:MULTISPECIES: dihydroxyacetone kinase family protein [unclassified Rhizobium]KQY15059.1 dihydroxyacetone kinase [Rhizobium sp. Root1334]KRC06592.1 dihydroxyacetone kinase [Rhizobium sp. Root73]